MLHVVVDSLEELFVEKCYDLITTAALRAMGGCKKLKVRCVSWQCHICNPATHCCDALVLQARASHRQVFHLLYATEQRLLHGACCLHLYSRRHVRLLSASAGRLSEGHCVQVLSLKGIRSALDIDDFAAIAALRQLEELVLDCDQPPELGGIDEIKWGLPEFPEGVLHLVNITHLTLSCHYGITELPPGITSLNKLEVRLQALARVPHTAGPPVQHPSLRAHTPRPSQLQAPVWQWSSSAAPSRLARSRMPVPAGWALPGLRPSSQSGASSRSTPCVQVLDLDFCTLSALPPVLGQLTCLTTLDVEGNLYLGDAFRGATTPAAGPLLPSPKPFPADLASLQNLRFLNLNSCGLNSVPMVRCLHAMLHSQHSHACQPRKCHRYPGAAIGLQADILITQGSPYRCGVVCEV